MVADCVRASQCSEEGVGSDLENGKILFEDVTSDDLRAALGERASTIFSSFSDDEPCVEPATGQYAGPGDKGAYCSALSVLLLACLPWCK